MRRLETLIDRYARYIKLPWRDGLTGTERTIMVVYDKADERRLRRRMDRFQLATQEAGHGWIPCDLTGAFSRWMAGIDYQESYFEHPEDLQIALEHDFLSHAVGQVQGVLSRQECDTGSVVALFGIASLFGFARLSALIDAMADDVPGRLVVFFPGEHEDNNYRLLDARDGWSYRAVPISVNDDHGIYVR